MTSYALLLEIDDITLLMYQGHIDADEALEMIRDLLSCY